MRLITLFTGCNAEWQFWEPSNSDGWQQRGQQNSSEVCSDSCTSMPVAALQVCSVRRSVPEIASSKPLSEHRAAATLRKSRDNRAANKFVLSCFVWHAHEKAASAEFHVGGSVQELPAWPGQFIGSGGGAQDATQLGLGAKEPSRIRIGRTRTDCDKAELLPVTLLIHLSRKHTSLCLHTQMLRLPDIISPQATSQTCSQEPQEQGSTPLNSVADLSLISVKTGSKHSVADKPSSRINGVFFLTLMTILRYLFVVNPLSTLRSQTQCCGVLVSLAVWTVSILIVVPEVIHTTVQEDSEEHRFCDYADGNWKKVDIYVRNVLFLLSFGVIVFCYFKILIILLRARSRRKHRTVRLILIIVVAFFLCWAPYNILSFLTTLPSPTCQYAKDSNLAFHISRKIAFSHCCLNPVLYLKMPLAHPEKENTKKNKEKCKEWNTLSIFRNWSVPALYLVTIICPPIQNRMQTNAKSASKAFSPQSQKVSDDEQQPVVQPSYNVVCAKSLMN
ncbi:hypothetical protein IHE44_0000454 [Lamprotornis superbus]|uniref:Chemokine XC receptor 1 n=1 Tax=Lamprotornis superbus TaxID=245042 RepID=A0A835TXT7_9PASS|nr:hypothetical protein IHE44_0000454 [Lamprotornis superbus]